MSRTNNNNNNDNSINCKIFWLTINDECYNISKIIHTQSNVRVDYKSTIKEAKYKIVIEIDLNIRSDQSN